MKIILFFLILSGLSWGNSSLNQKLERIADLGAELSREYPYTLQAGNEKIELSQRVELKNCQILLETFNDAGVIQRDRYDLSKNYPNRKLVPFKGTYVLDFGLKYILGERSFLHFDLEADRDNAHKTFSEYAKLCHKSGVKEHISINTESVGETRKNYLKEQENDMALLRAGNSFKLRYEALSKAQKSIYISQLFYRGDPTGIALANLMIQKRMEGKDVRVMVSGLFNVISNFDLKIDLENAAILMRNMMAAGIRVHGFGCKGWLGNAVRGINIGKILKPSHVKNWIIDGENFDPETSVSISGGMNISSRYFRMGKRLQWFDQDIGVRGPMVEEMHRGFLRDFYEREIHYNTFKEDALCLNTYDPISERKEYLTFKDSHTTPYKTPSTEEEIKEWGIIKNSIDQVLSGQNNLTPISWVKVERGGYVMGRPDEKEESLLAVQLDMVNKAQKEILIANVFSLFVPEMKLALRKAAARGVNIKILTNEPFTNKGIPMVNVLGRYYYRDLVYSNHPQLDEYLDPTLKFSPSQVEIFEWTGNKEDAEVQEAVMHAKFMVIDRKIGQVGSFNMDYASLKNPEQMVVFDSEELATQLADFYERDCAMAKKLTLKEIDSFKSKKGSRMVLLMARMLRTRL